MILLRSKELTTNSYITSHLSPGLGEILVWQHGLNIHFPPYPQLHFLTSFPHHPPYAHHHPPQYCCSPTLIMPLPLSCPYSHHIYSYLLTISTTATSSVNNSSDGQHHPIPSVSDIGSSKHPLTCCPQLTSDDQNHHHPSGPAMMRSIFQPWALALLNGMTGNTILVPASWRQLCYFLYSRCHYHTDPTIQLIIMTTPRVNVNGHQPKWQWQWPHQDGRQRGKTWVVAEVGSSHVMQACHHAPGPASLLVRLL